MQNQRIVLANKIVLCDCLFEVMDQFSTDPVSNILYNEEKILSYRPGGYHPVSLEDTFHNKRYRTVHKLGWGGFSTVWLARDTFLETWVAIKIARADQSIPSPELSNLEIIHQQGNSGHVVRLIDSFVHEGPNGSHQCIVLELLGPSVDNILADYHGSEERLDPEVILQVTRQLLEAISALHQAGYAHGDLSSANVVFTASKLSNLSEDELLDIVGHPKTTALVRVDGGPVDTGMPKELVRSADWAEWVDEDEEDIRLLDWEEAFKFGKEPARLAQPGELKAPETILTGHFDYRIDLWRAGCIIYTLLFAARPFQYLGEDSVLIAQMIGFVEDLPKQWQGEWESMKKSSPIVTSTPDTTDSNVGVASKLEDRFLEMVHEAELKPLLPVIRGLMRFLPSERLSAAEALILLN